MLQLKRDAKPSARARTQISHFQEALHAKPDTSRPRSRLNASTRPLHPNTRPSDAPPPRQQPHRPLLVPRQTLWHLLAQTEENLGRKEQHSSSKGSTHWRDHIPPKQSSRAPALHGLLHEAAPPNSPLQGCTFLQGCRTLPLPLQHTSCQKNASPATPQLEPALFDLLGTACFSCSMGHLGRAVNSCRCIRTNAFYHLERKLIPARINEVGRCSVFYYAAAAAQVHLRGKLSVLTGRGNPTRGTNELTNEASREVGQGKQRV